ncbi:MAG: DUF5615 family PIN-like protein [Planctomycetes bacterium]|nr:DUF5615 family PIN-like protein [Planctomycetota bacterium]
MHALADEGFSAVVIEALRSAGHDVMWSRDTMPAASDRAVLEFAQRENRVVLTDDRDFGELVFRLGLNAGSGVIYFRLGSMNADDYLRRVLEVVGAIAEFAGSFYVVGPKVVRRRPMQRDQHP